MAGGLVVFAGYKYNLIKAESRQKIDEARLLIQAGTEKSLNKGLELLTAIIFENISTQQEKHESLFYIGEIYEKLNMPEIAKKKYIQLLNDITPTNISFKERLEFKVAKSKIMSLYKDEALIRLLILIKKVRDKNFLSEIYTELGRLYLISRKVNKAVTSLKIALRENPNNQEAIKLLSKIKNSPRTDCEIAKIDLDDCKNASTTPDHVKVPSKNKGLIAKEALKIAFGYYGQHHYKKAIQYFRKIIDCCRNTHGEEIAWFYTGTAYAILGNYEQAIEAHEEVLGNSIVARDQLSMIRIGQLYFKKENFTKAIDYFRQSQKRYPNGKYLAIAKEWSDEAKKSRKDEERYND